MPLVNSQFLFRRSLPRTPIPRSIPPVWFLFPPIQIAPLAHPQQPIAVPTYSSFPAVLPASESTPLPVSAIPPPPTATFSSRLTPKRRFPTAEESRTACRRK